MPYRYIENCRYPRLYLNKSIDYFSYRYRNNTIAHALSIPGRDVEVNIHVFLRSMTWEIYSRYPEVTNATILLTNTTTYLLIPPTTGIYEKGKKMGPGTYNTTHVARPWQQGFGNYLPTNILTNSNFPYLAYLE